MQPLNYYSFDQSENIPSEPGVYSFLYNPYDPRALNIYVTEEPSENTVERAKESLSNKLQIYRTAQQTMRLQMECQVRSASDRVFGKFAGSLQTDSSAREPDFDFGDNQTFIDFLNLANSLSLLMQPLYCGITEEQTLRERYKQHRGDFDSKTPGTFGGRLANYQFNWEDLLFLPVPSMGLARHNEAVRLLETQLITFSNAIFSNR